MQPPYVISKLDYLVAGHSCILVISPPNKQDIKVKYALDADIDESLQGIEFRRAEFLKLRIGLGWNSYLFFKSLWDFHDAFIDKEGRKILVPLWPDVRKKDNYLEERIHSTNIMIGWNGLYEDFVVRDDGILPNTEYVCSGVIGYLETPSVSNFNSSVAEVQWSFIEDSKFEAGIEPNVSAASDVWKWPTNWIQNPFAEFESHTFNLDEFDDREQPQDGFEEVKVNYGQQIMLQKGDIADFLAFYVNRQGVVKPWMYNVEGAPPVETEWNDGSPVEAVELSSTMDFKDRETSEYIGGFLDETSLTTSIEFDEKITLQYIDVDGDEVSLITNIAFAESTTKEYISLSTEEVSISSVIEFSESQSSSYAGEIEESISLQTTISFEEYVP